MQTFMDSYVLKYILYWFCYNNLQLQDNQIGG